MLIQVTGFDHALQVCNGSMDLRITGALFSRQRPEAKLLHVLRRIGRFYRSHRRRTIRFSCKRYLGRADIAGFNLPS